MRAFGPTKNTPASPPVTKLKLLKKQKLKQYYYTHIIKEKKNPPKILKKQTDRMDHYVCALRCKPPGGFQLKKGKPTTITLENFDKRWKPPAGGFHLKKAFKILIKGGNPLRGYHLKAQTQWSIRD